MKSCRNAFLALACLASLGIGPALAQPEPSADSLLRFIPEDFGFCLHVNDLRGHYARWEKSDTLEAFRRTPPGRSLFDSPELKELAKVEKELKKFLGVNWSTLRDEVLGDSVVFAYRPASAGQPEQGLMLLLARQPNTLAAVVERVNELQRGNNEVKAVVPIEYHGATFFRREHVVKPHFYYLKGPLLAFAGSEELIKGVIDRERKAPSGTAWIERFRKAGANQAFVTLAVNPRAFDAELLKPGAGAQHLASFWRALDAAIVTVDLSERLEVRLALQGRAKEMPSWAAPLFAETPAASVLWERFPDSSVLTIAARNNFATLAERVFELMPLPERKKATDDIKRVLVGFTSLDLLDDVLPNMGPDWGVCVLPAGEDGAFPQLLAAVALGPGTQKEKVDATVLKGIQFAATLALIEHNRKSAEPVRLKTLQQGAVEVRYLEGEKTFPPGVRPAFALKDGFLVFATSPEAIEQFRPRPRAPFEPGITPLLHFSPPALAKLLEHRRAQVIASLQAKEKLTAAEAGQKLTNLLTLLSLCDRITLHQRSEPGQASWVLRAMGSRQ